MPESSVDRNPSDQIQTIVSESDLWNSESAYLELGESYFHRQCVRAWQLTWSRLMFPIASLIGATIIGLLAGSAWDSILAGVVSGVITLFAGFVLIFVLHYSVSAPKEIDEELRGDLKASRNQLAEEKRKLHRVARLAENYVQSETTKLESKVADLESHLRKLMEHKIKFKIDERKTRIFLKETDNNILIVIANIQMQFQNVDPNSWSIEGFDLTLHEIREGGATEVSTWLGKPQFWSGGSSPKHPEGMLLAGGETTPLYGYDVLLSTSDTDLKLSDLGSAHFLRLTMTTATLSPPFSAMMLADWVQAQQENGAHVMVMGAPAIHRFSHRIDEED